MPDKVLLLLEQLKDKGIDITHLDLGGGVGIDYEGEQTIDIKAYVDAIISKLGFWQGSRPFHRWGRPNPTGLECLLCFFH
jgi:diaminopimelate decarboxylase